MNKNEVLYDLAGVIQELTEDATGVLRFRNLETDILLRRMKNHKVFYRQIGSSEIYILLPELLLTDAHKKIWQRISPELSELYSRIDKE